MTPQQTRTFASPTSTISELRKRPARRGRADRGRDHRRRAQLLRRAQRRDGRDHPHRRGARARAASSRWPPGPRGRAAQTPTAPAVDGAYQLGRGEARSGRTVDALLSAYRIGARVSWREMSATAVRNGVDADTLGRFAELVFAYIDELSAASVAGHNDELATTGRVRQRLLERLAGHLLDGSPPEAVEAAAERADWTPPRTLTAVDRPGVAGARRARRDRRRDPAVDRDACRRRPARAWSLLLVPNVHGRRRSALLAVARGPRCRRRAGAAVAARCARRYERAAARARARPRHRQRGAPRRAGADRRRRAPWPTCAPGRSPRSTTSRDSARTKLTETLRSWLLHHGRRDAVAAELFVHPQTVRYRMGQLREVFGDRLEDPRSILELTIALGLPPDRDSHAARSAGAAGQHRSERSEPAGRRPRSRRRASTAAPRPARARSRRRAGRRRAARGRRGARRRRCRGRRCWRPAPRATVSACSGCHGSRSSPLRCTAAAMAATGRAGRPGASLPRTSSTPVVVQPAQREAAVGAVGPEASR